MPEAPKLYASPPPWRLGLYGGDGRLMWTMSVSRAGGLPPDVLIVDGQTFARQPGAANPIANDAEYALARVTHVCGETLGEMPIED